MIWHLPSFKYNITQVWVSRKFELLGKVTLKYSEHFSGTDGEFLMGSGKSSYTDAVYV